jgi:glycosyltransferase involved in cell wall biosynthesis
VRLGIDASNLRDGGGITHLRELLGAARPYEHGITRVTVWGSGTTLQQLPVKPWLKCAHEALLDQALPARVWWQKSRLPQLARHACDLLFAPGGTCGDAFRPVVTMSRNLLPFELGELRRYGASALAAKFLLLRASQIASCRRADGVIFLSDYARASVTQAARMNAEQPIIPHGVNQRFFLPPRTQQPLAAYSSSQPFRLLYVSKVEPYKHQWQVVEAVAKLRRTGCPITLELIGPPTHARATQRLRQTLKSVDPAGEFIHYREALNYSDLPDAYHYADGFVFASSCENLPNILLEAMAAGLPIACARRGPMPEVLRDAGVYFDPEKPDEIAAAIGVLLADHALREQCAWQAYTYAQTYSWERCAHATFSYLVSAAQPAIDCAPSLQSLAEPVGHH